MPPSQRDNLIAQFVANQTGQRLGAPPTRKRHKRHRRGTPPAFAARQGKGTPPAFMQGKGAGGRPY